MAICLVAPRHLRVAIVFLTFSVLTGARAQDAPHAATPSEQRADATGARGDASKSPSGQQGRLPPNSTTRHTLALPGRTLDFTATAGSIPVFNDQREPQH
jgi:hypothetical protein